ncbi:alkyl hydroperoxide reductase/ Thiol specific antioxidant/ Mal allergen [Stanieria sp. NIES-3757]|nr:alkyl hydroperoxide reductase/ Thiol specific antioxidant/ Mal allergen [Stanieria sp. NIES-3757]
MAIDRNLVGDYAPDFELPGIDKQVYHLGRYLEKFQALGVVFLANNCPYVKKYLERLKQIQADFAADGFTLVGINSNDTDGTIQESFESMESFAQANELNFPYLRDPTQDVAKSFGATVIPEVFLLDRQAVIRYAGRIDDCSDSAEQVTNHYLRNNISALLAGKEINPSYIEPIGSSIIWRANKS